MFLIITSPQAGTSTSVTPEGYLTSLENLNDVINPFLILIERECCPIPWLRRGTQAGTQAAQSSWRFPIRCTVIDSNPR